MGLLYPPRFTRFAAATRAALPSFAPVARSAGAPPPSMPPGTPEPLLALPTIARAWAFARPESASRSPASSSIPPIVRAIMCSTSALAADSLRANALRSSNISGCGAIGRGVELLIVWSAIHARRSELTTRVIVVRSRAIRTLMASSMSSSSLNPVGAFCDKVVSEIKRGLSKVST